ncbi:Uu.00g072350.m01.CDS01 [Anthostomella pinea]|uniref:Uu.00g072350.m01.CDS01 n=1 Tax=Anthostomella pinea TaxID=933095 RepID=A0AAI8VVY3_9PEZI|nr:Uu.00g072350.m01.CDS01 [Anthostomella pinea]
MADCIELELQTVEISSKGGSNLSLFTTSRVFITDAPIPDISPDDLLDLLLSKQLWLLSPGFCQLDFIVDLRQCHMSESDAADALDFMAETIRQCPLWPKLGLTIELLDVQHSLEYDGTSSICLKLEHLDKTCVLLCPPHLHTATLRGLECLLQFNVSRPKENDTEDSHTSNSAVVDAGVVPGSFTQHCNTQPSTDATMQVPSGDVDQAEGASSLEGAEDEDDWAVVARLIEATLRRTIGVQKRFLNLKLRRPKGTLSLLEIAPAIWNANYLQSIARHTDNFPVISSILMTAIKGQSPTLRRKGAELLDQDLVQHHQALEDKTTADDNSLLETSIQWRLWDLLQTSLKPTMRLKTKTAGSVLASSLAGMQAVGNASELEEGIGLEEGGREPLSDNLWEPWVSDSWPDLSGHYHPDDGFDLGTAEHHEWRHEDAEHAYPTRDRTMEALEPREEVEYLQDQDLSMDFSGLWYPEPYDEDVIPHTHNSQQNHHMSEYSETDVVMDSQELEHPHDDKYQYSNGAHYNALPGDLHSGHQLPEPRQYAYSEQDRREATYRREEIHDVISVDHLEPAPPMDVFARTLPPAGEVYAESYGRRIIEDDASKKKYLVEYIGLGSQYCRWLSMKDLGGEAGQLLADYRIRRPAR